MTSSVAKKRLALFASGRGSNGEALYKAMQEGYINGKFVVIITDHGDAGIVERSKPWNIPLIVIERSDYDSKTSFEQAQLDALEPYKVDGIVLAEYPSCLVAILSGTTWTSTSYRCGRKGNWLYGTFC